ncbi:glycosyltransferase [Actinomadura atramentaria]|uniref:glycosyltransferase n=1 Tax=Actinomadura atramentaria TaxID=1990 RepID=UPI0003A2679C|nr:glycosyltransferase [Actinomadura atramentaria]
MKISWASDRVRRGIGGTLVVASAGYVGWIATDAAADDLWISLPFLLANLFMVSLLCLTVFNNWHRLPAAVPEPGPFAEPLTAVLVPTLNEPPDMLRRTLESVLRQDWPHDRLVVVVGDDGRRAAVRDLVAELRAAFPGATLHYLLPPRRRTPERNGDAKDGNLNAMLAFVARTHPDAAFVETRDADDLVGDPAFLRRTVGHLVRHPGTAFVQTVKDAVVGPGDPFGNRRRFFYRGIMLSRAATGSAFPCGSGLVWRRADLEAIGGFPTWNLVEDLYSGYVALRHGLRGAYLPIEGAIGQVAPEDLPNVYKQLGTWAVDTLRILYWRSPLTARGLTLRQRAQFLEVGLFYLSSVPTLVLMLTPACCLLADVRMFRTATALHVGYSVAYVTLLSVFMYALGNGTSWREVWRAKQIWVGLTFVYIGASVRAAWYGPRRKPEYRVTRKVQRAGLYLREVAPHLALCALLVAALVRHAVQRIPGPLDAIDTGSVFWAGSYVVLLAGFVRRSWYGLGRAPEPDGTRRPRGPRSDELLRKAGTCTAPTPNASAASPTTGSAPPARGTASADSSAPSPSGTGASGRTSS